ncbi:hypothetical protein LPW11_14135 [Geomonas sp. RF6]|uniref:type II toxin-antitoxin system Phd/YefM family antitoxin n=1 Tax=Geomonas sp. RF6 TaxID=2897342 RepID=UPI001E3BBA33|nr:hypothetical protein [Geomonas sp. RF6]UFS69031.1 hypothetical protein LPW11_14135 [Geomonas sp. RF6]
MMKTVSKLKFWSRSLNYFRLVEQTGEEVVITDRGRPVLKVVPYVADMEDLFRGLRNTVVKYEAPLEPVELEEWDPSKSTV